MNPGAQAFGPFDDRAFEAFRDGCEADAHEVAADLAAACPPLVGRDCPRERCEGFEECRAAGVIS